MTNVDLVRKTAVRDGLPIIVDGRPANGYAVRRTPVTFRDLERLYGIYKHSTPDPTLRGRSYFKARREDEMSSAEIVAGQNRRMAKENLEMAVLEGILNGSLVWPDPGKWFWQSESDPDFVVLREWFDGNQRRT